MGKTQNQKRIKAKKQRELRKAQQAAKHAKIDAQKKLRKANNNHGNYENYIM